ncbi:MAG TPA: peroxidase family protein [Vicinamibacterales bacterium]|nr:peroxidase family protein [Vicinamibacterales bacterium]
MTSSLRFRMRRIRSRYWAIVTVLAMIFSPTGIPFLAPQAVVQAQVQVAPIGNGFVLDTEDLRFIFHQIAVAQQHVVTASAGHPCDTLIGPGPNQVNSVSSPNGNPQLPVGLRTVDGSCNNLVPAPDQHNFGRADRLFPRLTTPVFRDAEQGTSYKQKLLNNTVIDSQPRIITNLIADQSDANPAAVAVAKHPCGSGGFVCSDPAADPAHPNDPLFTVRDPASGALFIPNITPDFGLSAPFNLMFAFFGQFFDHGLDLVTKGGGTVIMPLRADDPLFVPGSQTNFMVMPRGLNQPGPDGVIGTADDIQETVNETTPWVDQNQTYTSHPSHQVFLRAYTLVNGRPRQTGLVLDGGFCAPRQGGSPGEQICDIGNWAEVKAQSAHILGIQLVDQDVLNVPLLLTDPYGHFKPGPNGFPQMIRPGNVLVQGNPAANGGQGVLIPDDAFRTGHAFLNDIAHNAVPSPGLVPDADTTICNFRTVPSCQAAGTYDDELLNAHFITGDGRGNENIGLTTVHFIFHAEHNRLRNYIDRQISALLPTAEINAWHAVHAGSGWDYNERLFQAARFVTEMQYQHLVFEEFARTVQPLINPFLGGLTSIDGAIVAEFAHTVYRLGHSMLPERLDRINADGSANEIRLFDAFLNPLEFNDGGPAGVLTADKAAGALVRGLSKQVGNELDEFVTSSVRNTLVGLPLDLAAINLARGRSEGVPSLNEARRQFFNATRDPTLAPYKSWSEFRFALRHDQSFVNFVAACGNHPTITGATTVADKRAAAQALVNANDPFLSTQASAADPTAGGLENVDFWIGGMAEKPNVFGGLLGPTFNVVFERQLEKLQDGDRFYYLQRTDGLNLKEQLEGNSFAELIRRNTDMGVSMDVVFNTADFNFDTNDPRFSSANTSPVDVGGGMSVFTLADGTKVFFDPAHSGKNITVNGSAGNDRWRADVGDDTMLGNGGADRLEGGEGNDTLLGGDGDDILLGGNGDDVLKGGPGNDAMESGPGFGADLEIGGDGNDFMVGGNDGVEYFAGPGNDILVDGSMRAEAIFGGGGDDWLDDGEGHDGGMFGDEGNVFDLLAGLSLIGGDDVGGGGPGQDNFFMEGGDDIALMSEGSNKFFGDYGFDWITLRGWNSPEFVELSLLGFPAAPINFNDLRNRYRFVDGASGWNLDDHIAGSNNVLCQPPAAVAECLLIGMELTRTGARKIAGLEALMGPNGFNANLDAPAVPGVKGVGFMGGDILLGGPGSDTLEGKQGDDLIDGDVWLNVQLEATYNDGTVRLVDGPRDLVADVLSDPQRLNPGNIRIVKTIVSPVAPPADCRAAAPLNCDTAVFNFPSTEYVITQNANGTVTVQHVPGGGVSKAEGTDTLRNMERAVFSDGVVIDWMTNSAATGTVTLSDTTPTEGVALTATTNITDPNGFDPATITFDWEMETTPGVFAVVATARSFTPRNPQVGHALRVAARFTDFDGFDEVVRSAPSAPVLNVNDPPVGAPTLSTATPQELEPLSASAAGITDADGLVGVTFNFQWQQATTAVGAPFNNIAGATQQTFTPAQAQVNGILRVVVSYTDNHGTRESVTSGATGVVGDVFVGTPGADTYNGTAGRDKVSGLGGADILNTGAGADVVDGGDGDDTINAGADNDVILYSGSANGFDSVNGDTGADEIRALAANTVIGLTSIAAVETINANGFANVTIQGSALNDSWNFSTMTLTGIAAIDSADGDDSVIGGPGNDNIRGGTGNDVLTGNNGADTLDGGDGADIINGNNGNDVITGGAGNDTMSGGAHDALADNATGNVYRFGLGSGQDSVSGFDSNPAGGQDRLDVSARGITAANFASRVLITPVTNLDLTVDTLVTFIGTTDTVRLLGVAAATVTSADFILAP